MLMRKEGPRVADESEGKRWGGAKITERRVDIYAESGGGEQKKSVNGKEGGTTMGEGDGLG